LGYDIQMEQFQYERLILAILACAQGRRILNRTKAYVKERIVFSRRLIEHQSLAFSLVKMELEQDFLQQMTYHSAELFMSGMECTRETAMVKLKASGLLRQVADTCLQMYGGYGYMEDAIINRRLRDARSASIPVANVQRSE